MPISSGSDMPYRSEIRRMFQGALGSLQENVGAWGIVPIRSGHGVEEERELNRKPARPGAKKLCQLFMI